MNTATKISGILAAAWVCMGHVPAQAAVLGYWNFEERVAGGPLAPGDTLVDLSGNGNVLTALTPAPLLVAGNPARPELTALAFTTANADALSGGDVALFDFAGTDSFAIEAMVRIPVGFVGTGGIVAKDVAANQPSWWLRTAAGKLQAIVATAGLQNPVDGVTLINDGAWHRVAFVRDAGMMPKQMRLYVDGVLDAAADDLTAGSHANGNNLIIGAFNIAGRELLGDIDYVRISSGTCITDPVVTTNADDGPGSLRQAIADACVDSSISFEPVFFGVPRTIALTTGELAPARNVAINGPGAALLTISGNSSSRILYINFIDVSLAGATLSGGNGLGAFDSGNGGAIRHRGGSLTINNAVIAGNVASNGGAMVANGNLSLTDVIVDGGSCSGGTAGGMIVVGSSFSALRTTVSGNTCGNVGGLYLQDTTATITDSTIVANSGAQGEAVRIASVSLNSSLALTNVTISGNSTVSGNSAIRSEPLAGRTATITLTNSTISGNSTSGAGGHGAIWQVSSGGAHVTVLRNTIVSGNTVGGVANDIEASLNPGSAFNLIGTGGGLVNGVNGNQVGISNPLLAPLANYGGTTQTRALLPGSPAINAGSNALAPAADQRGIARPQSGTADIGAFESQGFVLSPIGGSPQGATIGTAFAEPLTAGVVANASAEPVDGGRVSYVAPLTGASAGLLTSPATIAAGQVSIDAAANLVVGAYSVVASAAGASADALFALSNLATLPGAPVIGVVVPGNATATVNFAPPANSGGLPIIRYAAYCGPTVSVAFATSSPITVSGMSNGQAYSCQVSARNAIGTGAPSERVSVFPSAVSSTDLAISKSNGLSQVGGGLPLTYFIDVRNQGATGVASAHVVDALEPALSAASWVCQGSDGGRCMPSGIGGIDQGVDLPAGASVRFELTATVAAMPETPISNLASVALPAAISDTNPGNNVATDGPDIVGVFRGDFELRTQSIAFSSSAPALVVVGRPAYAAAAIATSGLPVSLSIDASSAAVCSRDGRGVLFIAAGSCVINANQAGNASHAAAAQVQQSVAVLADFCGSGVVSGAGEQCDDGNLANGDGCNATCQTEAGYSCAGVPSTCSLLICGNRLLQPGEQCDDGNTEMGDGCSATCALE